MVNDDSEETLATFLLLTMLRGISQSISYGSFFHLSTQLEILRMSDVSSVLR